MKYVITGSLGNISKPLAQKLISAGHQVTIITSKADKQKDIQALGAAAAVGSVEDVNFLTRTFSGADAVYTMVPPAYHVADYKAHIEQVGKNYAEAITKGNVKHVVNLSSVGAHMPEGCGPVSGIHQIEKAFEKLQNVNVLHLRPTFFFYNFLNNIGMIKGLGIIGGNYGQGTKLALVDTKDIAEVAAEKLLKLNFTGKSYQYISSDEKTTDEVASILGKSIGKPDLKWVDFTDEQTHGGMMQAGMSDNIASNFTEMGKAIRTGEMLSDFNKSKSNVIAGKSRFESFADTFAHVYQQN